MYSRDFRFAHSDHWARTQPMDEYDQIAAWYADTRNPEIGLPALGELVRGLQHGASILDLGCGNGIPISKHLVGAGLALIGVDSSREMIARFRFNLPGVTSRCQRAQDAVFENDAFDAVVAWGMMFHLDGPDQERVITNVGRWLKPGGRFLFTAGEAIGTRKGEMNGVTFEYLSLGSDAYRRLLSQANMTPIDEYDDAWDNRIFLAEKRR